MDALVHRRPGPARHRRRPGDRPRGPGGAGQAPGAPGPRGQGAARNCRAPEAGTFFAPVLAEIPAADFLEREVFGPVLHVVRYRPEDLEQVAGALAGPAATA